MYANMMNGQGWGGMGFGMIAMAAFCIVVIGLIVLLILGLIKGSLRSNSPQEKTKGRTAAEILQQRYAAGEIERDEYEQKKRDLGD